MKKKIVVSVCLPGGSYCWCSYGGRCSLMLRILKACYFWKMSKL